MTKSKFSRNKTYNITRHQIFTIWKSLNPFPLTTILQQTTLNIFCQKMENLYNWMDNLWLKWKTLWQKEKFLVLSNFFFCHYVFKNQSAAKASESVFMRERVKKANGKLISYCLSPCFYFTFLSNIFNPYILLTLCPWSWQLLKTQWLIEICV